MVWAWYPSNSRLAPHRLSWERYPYGPVYEAILSEKRRPLRAATKLVKPRKTIWERRRVRHQHFAGKLGEWPPWGPNRRPKRTVPTKGTR